LSTLTAVKTNESFTCTFLAEKRKRSVSKKKKTKKEERDVTDMELSPPSPAPAPEGRWADLPGDIAISVASRLQVRLPPSLSLSLPWQKYICMIRPF
jgi:hypothetical protein